MNIIKQKIGVVDHENIYAYTLENNHGMKLTCINFGCIVTEILAPDSVGKFENVVLGFQTIDEYIQHKTYFGAIVGRVAGRIKGAQFELDGNKYTLPANEGKNHLHGGIKGFHERIWQAETIELQDAVGVEFSYVCKDGEEGYPGNVNLTVTYLLTNENQWIVKITGISDKKTLLNMTNHTYFNLSGNVKSDILNHELILKSNHFLQLNEELLPTGKKLDVEGTVFDFRNGRKLRDGTISQHPQNILVGKGYDHPFILSEQFNQEIILMEHNSGRKLIVETNQPCVVLYTGNQMEGNFFLKEGVQARKYLGVCLETQGFPDAIHHPHFPSIVLEPNDIYNAITIYKFDVE